MRAKFHKEDIGSLWTPDQGENIQSIYRLQEFVPEPQVTMVGVGAEGDTKSGPVSDFKDFRRLTIAKFRVRKAEAAKKPRKERRDKGTAISPTKSSRIITPRGFGIRKSMRQTKMERIGGILTVISPLTEAGQENLGKPDTIGRTQEYQTLQSCEGCGAGLVMSFHLDSSVEVPEHWLAFCPGCGAAVSIANPHWDKMAEIK